MWKPIRISTAKSQIKCHIPTARSQTKCRIQTVKNKTIPKVRNYRSVNVVNGSTLTKPNQKRTFFTIIPEYERAVRLNFGKFASVLQPGIRLELPLYHTVLSMDMRDKVHTIPYMQVISADNVTFGVDASMQYRCTDAKKSLLKVVSVDDAISERCKMELRDKLSSMTINDVLQKKVEISKSVLDSMV